MSFKGSTKLGPKLMWRGKEPRIDYTTLKKKIGRLILPHFKTYCKATEIKTTWYW